MTLTTVAAERTINVGLGEICVSKDPSVVLVCYGLGSCIGLCVYDPASKIAGMAHIVLPESYGSNMGRTPTKYADIAVPLLLEEMVKSGAMKTRLVVKLVGGAQMLQALVFDDASDMGTRNLEVVIRVLGSEGIRPAATDTGGNQGRSMWLSVNTGKVMVRTSGTELKEL